MKYHNTNRLHGPDLTEAEAQCSRQERLILRLLSGLHDGQGMAPSKVHRRLGGDTGIGPITSVRRAMTNLTDRGELVKTDDTAPGPFRKPEHLWAKAQPTGQTGLFTQAA